MAAKWLWNTTNIYVDEQSISRELKRAELFVLDSTSSQFHYFGSGSRKRTITGLVIGDTDLSTLETDAINNTARTLTTPWGNVASARINGEIQAETIRYSGAEIDGVNYSVSSTPLYRVTLEIIV